MIAASSATSLSGQDITVNNIQITRNCSIENILTVDLSSATAGGVAASFNTTDYLIGGKTYKTVVYDPVSKQLVYLIG